MFIASRRRYGRFWPVILQFVLFLSATAGRAEDEAPLRIVLTGDIMPASYGRDAFAKPLWTWNPEVEAVFQRADAVFGNLEGVLLDDAEAEPRPCGDLLEACWRFRMPAAVAQALKNAHVTAVSLANNHIGDYGAVGRTATAVALAAAGVEQTGLSGAPPAIIAAAGKRIGFAAFAPNLGVNDLRDIEALRRTVQALAAATDIVVVSFHAGAEGSARTPEGIEYYVGDNRGDVRSAAHAAVEAGASLVFAHGPHVPRAVEIVRDRLILYSLGNFWVGRGVSILGPAGLAPLVEVDLNSDGSLSCAAVRDLKAVAGRPPEPDPDHRASGMIRVLTEADFPSSKGRIWFDGTISATASPCSLRERGVPQGGRSDTGARK